MGDEVYACGCPEKSFLHPLPENPLDITPDAEKVEILIAEVKRCSSFFEGADIKGTHACYLPGSEDEQPVIGPIQTTANGFIACGHTCWGILNAPATGRVISELVADGKATSVDVRQFACDRGR